MDLKLIVFDEKFLVYLTRLARAGGRLVGTSAAGGCDEVDSVVGVTVAVLVLASSAAPVVGVVLVALAVPLLGMQPGWGTHRDRVPVMQKHRPHWMDGGVQNWAMGHCPVTRAGTKWMFTESATEFPEFLIF